MTKSSVPSSTKRRKLDAVALHNGQIDWNKLPEDTMVMICSFCDLIDTLALRCSCNFFRFSSLHEIKQRRALSFSSFIQTSSRENSSKKQQDYNRMDTSYRLSRDWQGMCVNKMLNDALDDEGSQRPCNYQRLDFCNMSHIKSLSLSCFHFDKLVSLDLSFCSRLDPDSLMKVIVESEGSTTLSAPLPLKELYLSGCRRIKGEHISRLVQVFTKIEVLHISGCSQTIDDDCVENIVSNLKELHSLDLEGFKRISDRSSSAIFLHAKNLRHLNVDQCEGLQWTFFDPLAISLSQLLNSEITSGDIVNAFRTSRSEVASRFSSLRDSLNFCSFQLEVANVSFGPSTRGGLLPYRLASLAISSFWHLRELNVSGSRIVDTDIEIVMLVCKNSLKSLEMNCCSRVADGSLQYISLYGENLVSLDVSACFALSDYGFAKLASCSQLHSLKASSLGNVTDESVSHLQRLRKLIRLDLHDCSLISQSCIKRLLQELPNLIDIDVRNINRSGHKITLKDKENLSIFNGRKCGAVTDDATWNLCHCCSVRQTSQRVMAQQGARPRKMYHCQECQLLPKFNRGMCVACAAHCHKDHRGVYFGAVTFFYCDCAFGFSAEECKLKRIYSGV